jgi:hypothetical protein
LCAILQHDIKCHTSNSVQKSEYSFLHSEEGKDLDLTKIYWSVSFEYESQSLQEAHLEKTETLINVDANDIIAAAPRLGWRRCLST